MLPVHRDRLLDSLEPRETSRKEPLKASPTWIQPIERSLNTCRHRDIRSGCKRVNICNSSVRRAACSWNRIRARPRRRPTHGQKRKRRERRKGGRRGGDRDGDGGGGPCQNSSAVSEEMRQGGGRERRMMSPSAHLERAVIVAHPDAQRRRGGDFSSLSKFRRNQLYKANKTRRVSPIYVSRCAGGAPAGCSLTEEGGCRFRWRDGGSTEPSSSLLLALTDPLQKREERQMKPYSFLFFSRWHDRGGTILPLPPLSLSLSRDAFTRIPENPASLRFAFSSSDDAFCGTHERPADLKSAQLLNFNSFPLLFLKSNFETLTTVFPRKVTESAKKIMAK